jgi:hypothetical protein
MKRQRGTNKASGRMRRAPAAPSRRVRCVPTVPLPQAVDVYPLHGSGGGEQLAGVHAVGVANAGGDRRVLRAVIVVVGREQRRRH